MVLVFLFAPATGWPRMIEFCTFLYWRTFGVRLWYSSLTWEKWSSTRSEFMTSGLIAYGEDFASSITPWREQWRSHMHSAVGLSSGLVEKLSQLVKNCDTSWSSLIVSGVMHFLPPKINCLKWASLTRRGCTKFFPHIFWYFKNGSKSSATEVKKGIDQPALEIASSHRTTCLTVFVGLG